MNPIERAARALAKTDDYDPDALVGDPPQPLWQLYVPKARTVIQAIRKPSEAMIEIGGRTIAKMDWRDPDEDPQVVSAICAWEDMIDAALSEGS